MAFKISNIIPNLTPKGGLISIAFQASITDGDIVERESFATPYPLPAREDDPYIEAELMAVCETLAANAQLQPILQVRVDQRKKRVPAPAAATPAELTDTQKRAMWIDQVDNTIGGIILTYTRFERGYVEREAAAHAYVDSGHTIDPTEWITRFADNVGMSYPNAAALILAQAAKLRPAVAQLDNLRMDKYLIQRAPTISAAQAEYQRIMAEAQAIAASLK